MTRTMCDLNYFVILSVSRHKPKFCVVVIFTTFVESSSMWEVELGECCVSIIVSQLMQSSSKDHNHGGRSYVFVTTVGLDQNLGIIVKCNLSLEFHLVSCKYSVMPT